MTNQEINFRIALDMVSFDYFKICINNGATPEEAKKEMMTERAQKIMLKRIDDIMSNEAQKLFDSVI